MSSTQSLLFQAKVRRHETEKNARKTMLMLKFQRFFGFILQNREQTSINLSAVTFIGLASKDLADKMLGNPVYMSMSRSNLFNDAIRFLGFSLIRLLKALLDFSSDVMTSAYNLFSFSTSSDVNSYITQLMGFLWIPCIISLLILGIQLILNPKDRPDTSKIIQNALLIIVLVTGLPALLSTTASVTKQFVEANGSTGKNVSGTIIAEHLTDYAYLYDWKTMEFPKTLTDSNGNPIAKNKYTANDDSQIQNIDSLIDINETMRWDNINANPYYSDGGNTEKWDDHEGGSFGLATYADGKMGIPTFTGIEKICWLCTSIEKWDNSNYALYHIDSPGWLEYFNDSFFYRYNLDLVPCMVTLIAMIAVLIFSAIKIIRILWELAVYRVLAMFFSVGDIKNGEKIKEIIKAFAGAFLVIIINSILIKFFLIYSGWLSKQTGLNSFVKSIFLVAVAIAVIDGPNLVQKLIGVDSGIRSALGTLGAIYAAGKIAKGVGKTGANIGHGAAEFGKDVAHKGAAVGGFTAGVGANAVSSVMDRIQNPGRAKDEKKADKQQQKQEAAASQQSKAEQQARESRNASIQSAVNESAGANRRNNPDYTSDNVDAYSAAAGTVYSGSTQEEQLAMGQDAYLSTHGEQMMREAAEMQDEARANGTNSMSDKDAITSAFAKKHSDPTSILQDNSKPVDYSNATQGTKNRIDNMVQSQSQQGNTLMSARTQKYQQLGQVAKGISSRDNFRNATAVQAHTAAAAQAHGRTYDPSSGIKPEKIDAYQGNMSAALAHKDEIMTNAKEFMEFQKSHGQKVTMEEAVADVIRNEDQYDMSYGFDETYAKDIANTLMAADVMEKTPKAKQETTANEPAPSPNRRNLTGTNSVNESLRSERQRHEKPQSTTFSSARKGFEAGRNLRNPFRRNKDKK